MNAEMKVGMLIGFLKGLVNGDTYFTTVNVKEVKDFIKEIENA